jgi:hypothetical protein
MPGALVQVETGRRAGIAIRESVHDDGTRVAVRDAALRVQQAAEAMGARERQTARRNRCGTDGWREGLEVAP